MVMLCFFFPKPRKTWVFFKAEKRAERIAVDIAKGGLIAERVKIEGIHLRKNVRHLSSENKHKSVDLEGKKMSFRCIRVR